VDIDALHTFLAIHRRGTITAAAGELFRSQPAVSRRLALLEAGLGAPLFERVAGGLVLSEAGHALLPFAEKMVATLTDAEAAVRAVRSEDTGPVRIALVGTLASTDLTSVLRRFARRHPGVELILRTATSREVSELVRRAEVQLGLRYHRDPNPELHSETLFAERLVVAAAPGHPFAGTGAPACPRSPTSAGSPSPSRRDAPRCPPRTGAGPSRTPASRATGSCGSTA